MKKIIKHSVSKIDREAERQRTLKEILINVRNGAMITPAIFVIEQLYSGDKNA